MTAMNGPLDKCYRILIQNINYMNLRYKPIHLEISLRTEQYTGEKIE